MSDDDLKITEVDDEDRQKFVDYITARWSQFSAATRESRKDATKFIAAISAGGAATMLAFMGALLKDRLDIAKAMPLKLALLAFASAIVFCGVAHAVTNTRLSGLFKDFRADAMRFYDGTIGFKTLQQSDRNRYEVGDSSSFFIWGALILFFVGAGLGVCVLFTSD